MLLSKRSDLFFFSSVHKKDQKKSPGVFKTECSRTLFAGKKRTEDQTQTKSVKKPN